jgi:Protein of unknown function (DUF2811)
MSQTPEFPPAYVSLVNEVPEDLYEALRNFVASHPNWDQYRVMQVALAGFLFQQGSRERAVARHYLDGLFDRNSAAELGTPPARPPESRTVVAANPAITATERSGGNEPEAETGRRSQAARSTPAAVPTRHRQGPPPPPHRGR